jgi:hypothetical protein
VHLWSYESFQHRSEVRAEALKSSVWRNTVAETTKLMVTQESTILYPTLFSPLK